MKPIAKIKKLGKMMTYLLGRHPEEFGLVPDADGFVDIKTALQALHEEEGWRHVRLGDLNALNAALLPSPVEMRGQKVRATDRSQLPKPDRPRQMPKLLYLAIRRRAYARVAAHGIDAPSTRRLIMSSDRTMALRLGRRIDNAPVILTVQVAATISQGTHYRQFGQTLFLADRLAPGTFSGPPLPKAPQSPGTGPLAQEPQTAKTPGSYSPDPSVLQRPGARRTAAEKKRKKDDWKKERRQQRRHKQRQQQ